MAKPCAFCSNEIPQSWPYCPHCARPNRFPNVEEAKDSTEISALEERYQRTLKEAASRGTSEVINKFSCAVGASKAVIARPLREADRLATSDRQIYATYYQLLSAGIIYPDDSDPWHKLRTMADTALFADYKGEIRFAALTLNGLGLTSYGECFLVLKEEMSAHRASVFEGNSTVLLKQLGYKPPQGFRATWENRTKLCIAKLGTMIEASLKDEDFQTLLISDGRSQEEDQYIEVHIWGPITRRTLERVFLSSTVKDQIFAKSLSERLEQIGVPVESF